MQIRYNVPFKRDILISDHWPIPMMGGLCRIIEKGGLASALEVTFVGQPVGYAPAISEPSSGPIAVEILGRDDRWVFLKRHLDQVAAFLGCYHDLDLATNEIEGFYEAETPDEEPLIKVKSLRISESKPALPLSFDMLTRANMAAEKLDGPAFEATLYTTAMDALGEQRFIDSFRYSFLLIEALFGGGQFKKAGLQKALKQNQGFVSIVNAALADPLPPKPGHKSKTVSLLQSKPSASEVIDHLVEQRGFYFHGNVNRKDGWKPDAQEEAQALATLSLEIVQLCVAEAAAPIFQPEFAQRHFDDAVKVGALIVFEVKFKFREQGDPFERDGQIDIQTPGTKVTGRQANAVAQQFLRQFEYDSPVGALSSAQCTVRGTGQPVFGMTFFQRGDGK